MGHNTQVPRKPTKVVLPISKPQASSVPLPKPIARAMGKGIQNIDEGLSNAYNPEAPFMEHGGKSLVGTFLESLYNFVGEKKEPNPKGPGIVSARIFEVNKYGGYRIRKITSIDELRQAVEFCESEAGQGRLQNLMESGLRLRPDTQLTESEKAEIAKLREDSFDTDDPPQSSSGTNPFQEYLPMLGGPFSKQLYLFDYLDMHRKCFEAWNHNPIAHNGVRLITQFVLGRGVSWKACHPECQKAFDKWADKNNLNGRLEDWSDMLTRDGELMVRKFKNNLTKELFLRWADPSACWEIVTDLEDIERVIYYHFQFPTQYQVLYGDDGKGKFDPNKYGCEKYVIEQVPADDIIHIKINCSPNEKRGRSDLFSILGWLKRYKDFWTSRVLTAIIQSTFSWKNKIKGNDADVQAFMAAFGNQQPQFGSVWVENEASELTPMTISTNLTGTDADAPGIINMIAVGLGVPKEYLGFSEHATRATAVVASEPGTKKFESRQLLLGRLLRRISDDWGALELASNRLPAMVEDPETGETVAHEIKIEFQFPEIATSDRSAKLKDIEATQLAGFISKERAATLSAKELGIEEYSYEKEQEEISEEAQSDANDLYARTKDTLSGPVGKKGAPERAPKPGVSGEARAAVKKNDAP